MLRCHLLEEITRPEIRRSLVDHAVPRLLSNAHLPGIVGVFAFVGLIVSGGKGVNVLRLRISGNIYLYLIVGQLDMNVSQIVTKWFSKIK